MGRAAVRGCRRLHLRTTVTMVVLGFIVVSAGTLNAAASSPRTEVRGSAIAWKKCDPPADGLECAKVAVPLDWDHPNGKQIDLAVIRHRASRPQERIGTLFVNPGGPGSSGVDFVRDVFRQSTLLDDWGRGRFDVVSWDPRGTNRSSPVECFTSEEAAERFWGGVSIPTTRAESEAYQRKTVELARRCGDVNGDLLNHISTADTARDLEALRRLVGDDRLTYVGLSYGTMIGQTYVNLFPGRVRAMVLDGVVDAVEYTTSAETRVANQSASFDAVFGKFLELCQRAGPDHCALAGHGESAARRVARVFTTARQTPIPAPHSNPPGALGYGDLLLASFNPLRIPEDWPQFAQDLNEAADGDASALEDTARLLRTPGAFTGATTSAAISCVDGRARRPSQAWPSVIPKLTEVSRVYGPVLGWWLWAPCASNWPAHSNDRYAGPWDAKTHTPILLLNNVWDPATGYQNAVVAERRLGNAVLLTQDGHGHLTMNDPGKCVDQARTRYLIKLVTPPRGTICHANQVPFS